ncbi:MAG: PqqD family protein [Theionarchaea archaeon]|nr:PqqD family protein [Theionarchaea archaeon]MBU7000448.1 PqqD family protein [Theionarchaea archaeon]MBU7020025.1 PqqD family protein [Theionarchaea archaeon]MBU7035901.1 PqqD family protein [Theionarchaea archaeon]MBU7041593.1 PqqD family protein [Theionarchaea archaeon]
MEDLEHTYIRWSDNCVWQSFGETLAVVHTTPPDEGLIPSEDHTPGIQLNDVGKDVWELCDGSRTFNAIYEQLLEEYEGDSEKIKEDLKKTVTKLEEKGFLTFEDAPREYEPIEINLSMYPYWDDNVLWNEVENQVVAMNNQTGVSFEFPEDLGEFWKLCNGRKTVSDILATLEEKGVVTKRQPRNAFTLLLKKLVKLNMVVMRDAPVP